MKPLRVVLVDDHPLFRQALTEMLAARGLHVVGQGGDGQTAVTLAQKHRPDLILLDYTMPGLDATAVTEQIRAYCPSAKILVLSMHDNVYYALKMLQAGAHGFALKAGTHEELFSAIAAVMRGETYVAPPLVPAVIRRLADKDKPGNVLDTLSPREFQLLRHLGAGKRPAECAKAMGVSPSTVAGFRARLLDKLGFRTTAELVKFAIEQGLVG